MSIRGKTRLLADLDSSSSSSSSSEDFPEVSGGNFGEGLDVGGIHTSSRRPNSQNRRFVSRPPRTPSPVSVESEPFCDCLARGKEKECVCAEEDTKFDWVWDDKSKSLDSVISKDRREVRFHIGFSSGTAAVRGTAPLTEGQHYWEVKMTSAVYGTDMMVGVGTSEVGLNDYTTSFISLLGKDSDSWGLSYSGRHYLNGSSVNFCERFGQQTIIGVHLNTWSGTISYYKNRKLLGTAANGICRNKSLFPIVSSTAAKTSMKLTKACSFPTSLQFHCCMVLRRALPPEVEFFDVVDLPPGLGNFLRSNLDWLLRSQSQEKLHKDTQQSHFSETSLQCQ